MDAAWIAIGVVIGAALLYAGVTFLAGGTKPKGDPVAEADKRAADVKAAAEAALQLELQRVEADRRRLEQIKAITDETERLKALADFANRVQK